MKQQKLVAAANSSDKLQKKKENRKWSTAAKEISANASVVIVSGLEGNPREVTASG